MSGDEYRVGHETYWAEIDVTEEREAAWTQWVGDYIIRTAATWVEQGATHDEVMNTAASVFMDWQEIDGLPWMPLGPALVESMMMAAAPPEGELEGQARLDYQRAQRTIQTASELDRVMAGAYHLGVEPETAEAMAYLFEALAARAGGAS